MKRDDQMVKVGFDSSAGTLANFPRFCVRPCVHAVAAKALAPSAPPANCLREIFLDMSASPFTTYEQTQPAGLVVASHLASAFFFCERSAVAPPRLIPGVGQGSPQPDVSACVWLRAS